MSEIIPKIEDPSLVQRSRGQISEETEAVVSLFSVDGVGSGLKAQGFDLEEHVETLVEIIRSGQNKDKIAAGRELRRMAMENMTLNGLMGNASSRRTGYDEQGREVVQEASVKRLLVNMENHNNDRDRSTAGTRAEGITSYPPKDPANSSAGPLRSPPPEDSGYDLRDGTGDSGEGGGASLVGPSDQ